MPLHLVLGSLEIINCGYRILQSLGYIVEYGSKCVIYCSLNVKTAWIIDIQNFWPWNIAKFYKNIPALQRYSTCCLFYWVICQQYHIMCKLCQCYIVIYVTLLTYVWILYDVLYTIQCLAHTSGVTLHYFIVTFWTVNGLHFQYFQLVNLDWVTLITKPAKLI